MEKIILKPGTGSIVEKKSRFIGEIKKISSAQEAAQAINDLKKRYFDARHNCYAYRVGTSGEYEKYSDDGEPAGTAGQPLLMLLRANGITDVLLTVTRYFGGVLLGTGGLARAYRAAGEAALSDAVFAEALPAYDLRIDIDFKDEDAIRRFLKNKSNDGVSLEIKDVTYLQKCSMRVSLQKDFFDSFTKELTDMFSGKALVDIIGDTEIYRQ